MDMENQVCTWRIRYVHGHGESGMDNTEHTRQSKNKIKKKTAQNKTNHNTLRRKTQTTELRT